MVGSHLRPGMPHARYTHEVIELTDGRCYCLACDEVVPQEYLQSRREVVAEPPTPTGPSSHSSPGS